MKESTLVEKKKKEGIKTQLTKGGTALRVKLLFMTYHIHWIMLAKSQNLYDQLKDLQNLDEL